jgi:hypothetical protein
MHYVYKLPDDYDFSYWSTPIDDLSRIQSISEKRAYEWSLTASVESKRDLKVVTSLLPTHYLLALSIAITKAVSILTNHLDLDMSDLSSLYLQRVPELEAGSEILFILGFACGSEKYAVSSVDLSNRINLEQEAELLGSYEDDLIEEE